MSDKKKTKKKPTTLKGKILRVLDFVIPTVCLGVIVFAGYNLYTTYQGYNEAKEIYDGLSLYVNVDEDTVSETEEVVAMQEAGFPYIDVDFEALSQVNEDFLGWLYFPLMDISYPVVYGDEAMTYLHMAMDGTPSNSGTIYIDYESNPNLEDSITLIFGHNMRNGSMFGSLKRIRQEEGLIDQDPYFYYYTPTKAYKCHIFAYYLDNEGSITYYLGEKNKAGYDEYMTYVLEKNEYEGGMDGIDLSHRPQIIGLSTCAGHNTGKRTVLQAVVEDTYEIGENTIITDSFEAETAE